MPGCGVPARKIGIQTKPTVVALGVQGSAPALSFHCPKVHRAGIQEFSAEGATPYQMGQRPTAIKLRNSRSRSQAPAWERHCLGGSSLPLRCSFPGSSLGTPLSWRLQPPVLLVPRLQPGNAPVLEAPASRSPPVRCVFGGPAGGWSLREYCIPRQEPGNERALLEKPGAEARALPGRSPDAASAEEEERSADCADFRRFSHAKEKQVYPVSRDSLAGSALRRAVDGRRRWDGGRRALRGNRIRTRRCW